MNGARPTEARADSTARRPTAPGRGFVGVCAAVTLGASLVLLLFSQPLADDFCIGRDVSRHGVLGGLETVLNENSSRWAGKTVEYILHAAFEATRGYAAALLLIRSIFLGSLYLLLKACLRDTRRRELVFLTLLLATAYFVGMKDPAQTWYWLPGAVEYDLGFALTFLSLAVLVRALELGRTRGVWWSAGILFVATGFHELIGLLSAGLLVVVWSVTRRGARSRIAVVLLAALTGSGLLLLVPGGWNRMADTANRSVFESLHVGMNQAAGNVSEWIFQPSLLLLWTAVLLGLIRLDLRSWLSVGTSRSAAVAVVAWLGGSLGPFVVAALAGGKTAPYRTVNSAYLWFLLGSLYLLAEVARRWRTECPAAPSLILLLLLGSSLPLTGHGRSLWNDLFFEAPEFSRRSGAHFAALSNAAGLANRVEIELDDRSLPRLFYTSGLATEDPAHWHNRCVADYFDVGEVLLRRRRHLGDPPADPSRRQDRRNPAPVATGGGVPR
jgi:hypothetical protein